jgi:hypothetical protein
MLNKINFDDPVTYAIIGFLVIFTYQYYNKQIKDPKDDDDYKNDSNLISLLKIPILAGFLIWIVCNYLSLTKQPDNKSNVSNLSNPSISTKQPIMQTTRQQPVTNKDLALRDIFTDQPNF